MELLEQRPPEEAVRPPEAEPEASPSVPETEPQAAPEDRPESPLLLPEGEALQESPAPLPEQSPQAPRQRRSIRPEWIMGLIAILAAALLLVMVVLCLPYMSRDEDPESLPRREEPVPVTQEVHETILEPTISETEPENPTIPPDPNPYDRYDFQYNRHNYLLLQNLRSYPGVDVSAHQGSIDWEAVAASGIRFAMIRLGYRGYGTGKLVEDEYAKKNLQGAKDAGLDVGAYFFSQALNIREADEEIKFMLNILGEQYLDMPIVLDWEIPTNDARTAGMDGRTLTDIQLHFCSVMAEKGYQPMVYFNWYQSEHMYVLSELEDYPFWLALYQDRMTYPWKVELWQYTDKGRVPGISGNVDLNVYMPD